MDSLITILRRQRHIVIPLLPLLYKLRRIPGLDKIIVPRPELEQLPQIVKRSAEADLTASGTSPRILFFTFRGWTTHVFFDALTAHALRLRGADVRFFTCGGRLPICDICSYMTAPPMPCDLCAPYVERVLSSLRLPFQKLRDFTSSEEQAEIRQQVLTLDPASYGDFEFEGLPLGQLVKPSVQWFLLRGSLGTDRLLQETYREFLVSGCLMVRVAQRLLDSAKPDILYLMNGLFFAEHLLIALARQRAIPFITHEGGFSSDTQLFAWNDMVPYYGGLDAVWPTYAALPLTASEEHRLDAYLDERQHGKHDVKTLYPRMTSETQAVLTELDLDPTKTIVTLFTNINWDTAAFARPAAFPDMFDWIEATIRHFALHPEIQLLIRIHPGEVRLPFKELGEKAYPVIRERFPKLPDNVRVIPAASAISSYTLMELSRLGLVYTSTVGMEMALRGKPVITAGTGYYANKGFTFDARTPAEYAAYLDRLSDFGSLDLALVTLARRYACLFFFRYQLPFPFTTKAPLNQRGIRLNFETLAALRPGSEPNLDLICQAILEQRPFIYTGPL
jgi:hypothetical protein